MNCVDEAKKKIGLVGVGSRIDDTVSSKLEGRSGSIICWSAYGRANWVFDLRKDAIFSANCGWCESIRVLRRG